MAKMMTPTEYKLKFGTSTVTEYDAYQLGFIQGSIYQQQKELNKLKKRVNK